MITTTKEEIRKAVMEALEEVSCGHGEILDFEHQDVADLVAETLGGEG